MPDSDRKKIKDQQKGMFQTAAGITAPGATVGEMHEETFLIDVPADAALVEKGFRCNKAFRLKSVYFTPTTALATNGTNYITATVSKRDGAGGAAVIAATGNTNTGGTALAAFVPAALTPSATSANLNFAVGNVLTFLLAETGTPVTPVGFVAVTVEYGVL